HVRVRTSGGVSLSNLQLALKNRKGREMISSRTRRNLATASIGALATLLWANSAAAQQQNACGPLIDGQVFCPSDGATYPEGIRYDAAGNITLNLGEGLSLAPV